MATNGDDTLICARCGWLRIDDECGCTPPSVSPSRGGGANAGVALATFVAAAIVVLALVTVTTA